MPTFDGSPTAAERLILKTMKESLEDGYDAGNALIRTAHTLGLNRERVLKAWILFRVKQEVA